MWLSDPKQEFRQAAERFREISLSDDVDSTERRIDLEEQYKILSTPFAAGSPYETPSVTCVQSEVRTMIMLEAIVHLVEAGYHDTSREIKFVEAGCGTALFACFAAAIRGKINALGFEIDNKEFENAKRNVRTVGLDGKVKIEQRDLIENPYEGDADIVLAEHLSRGLMEEHAAKVGRAISRGDLKHFIPYSVRPNIVLGPSLHRSLGAHWGGGNDIRVDQSKLEIFDGKEIELGDRTQEDKVVVEGESILPYGITPLWAANDIRWLAPEFAEGDRFVQTTRGHIERWLNSTPEEELDQCLLGIDPLREGKRGSYYGLLRRKTLGDWYREIRRLPKTSTRFQVRYEFGFAPVNMNRNRDLSTGEVLIITDSKHARGCRYELRGFGEETTYIEV